MKTYKKLDLLTFEKEAAAMSIAGQITVLQALGAKIIDARVNGVLRPVIHVKEHDLFRGFTDQTTHEFERFLTLEELLSEADDDMRWRVVIAQMLVIHAGEAILYAADFTSRMDLIGSAACDSIREWSLDFWQVAHPALGLDVGLFHIVVDVLWLEVQSITINNLGVAYSAYRKLGRVETLIGNHLEPSLLSGVPVKFTGLDELVSNIQEVCLEQLCESISLN